MNKFFDGTDTVDTTDALHKACGIPRRIVIEDYVCTVEVDTFGENFGGYDSVVFIALLILWIVGIEVLSDFVSEFVASSSSDFKDLVTLVFKFACNSFKRVDGFGEDNEFGLVLPTGIVDCRIEEFTDSL